MYPGDLTRVAQAKRRQRVRGRTPSPLAAAAAAATAAEGDDRASMRHPLSSEPPPVVLATSTPITTAASASATTHYTSRSSNSSFAAPKTPGGSLMDRSMEAGDDAAALLASIRSSTAGTVKGDTTRMAAGSSSTIFEASSSLLILEEEPTPGQRRQHLFPTQSTSTNRRSAVAPSLGEFQRPSAATSTAHSFSQEQQNRRQPIGNIAEQARRLVDDVVDDDDEDAVTPNGRRQQSTLLQQDSRQGQRASAPYSNHHQADARLLVRRREAPDATAITAASGTPLMGGIQQQQQNTLKNRETLHPPARLSSPPPPQTRQGSTVNYSSAAAAARETAGIPPQKSQQPLQQGVPARTAATTTKSAMKKPKTKTTTIKPAVTTSSLSFHLPDPTGDKVETTLYDAACFLDQSKIMLQSFAFPTNCLSAEESQGEDSPSCFIQAAIGGKFLGQANEILQVVSCAAVQPSGKQQQQQQPRYVCFGDKVTLQWWQSSAVAATKSQQPLPWLLGVQPRPIDENDPNDITIITGTVAYDVGFFPPATRGSSSSKFQQWIVFRAHCGAQQQNNAIKVGRAALEEDAVNRVNSNARRKTTAVSPQPVRSGDPAVFRNCQTGGILSCCDAVQSRLLENLGASFSCGLQLLTDAYLQPQVAAAEDEEDVANPDGEPSLMTRLHRSDKLIPSASEIFAFRQSASPAVPLWISSSNVGGGESSVVSTSARRQYFLDGSYLWYPDRHRSTHDTDEQDRFLFCEENKSAGLFVGVDDQFEVARRDQMQTPEGQELVLLDELIGACMGLEGRFVKAVTDVKDESSDVLSAGGLRYVLLDDAEVRFDVILRRLVEDMLPLPAVFARVRCFLHRHTPGYEYGSVMQALCESLGQLLEQYVGTVVSWQLQYRRGELTVSGLQVQLRSSMHSLSVMARVCTVAQDKKGGDLLNALQYLKLYSYEGDEVADRILQLLLDTAAVPFMSRLFAWLELGILDDDPHEEFMIQRNEAKSWESKYMLSSINVLDGFFSTTPTVERVLAAGRYWNAVRSCEKNSDDDAEVTDESTVTAAQVHLQYSSSSATVSSFVQRKYCEASRALVRLLMDDYNLLGALLLMKRYFLMEHGDFFVNFLDCAEDEMLKDVAHLSRNRIQHWMNSCLHVLDQRGGDGEASIGCSSRRKDAAPTGLRCRFSTVGLTDHLDKLHAASGGIDTHEPWTPMRHAYGGALASTSGELTGLDSFYLDFASIPFPTSIVLSPSAMECYQLLFRHLFFAKLVERRLVSIWKDHQMMKELQALRGPMGATFLLRQRMLHFLQNLIYYMMCEVIEPNWLEMEKAIGSFKSGKEQTVDDILKDHSQFLHRTLEACLLTNRDLVRALTKLLKTCLLFSEQMKRFMKATKIEEERNAVATEMQKEIQHNLNSRGGARSSKATAKYLHESLQHAREEKVKRVQRQSARVEREVSGEPYRRMVTRFEEVFSKNLRDFMIQLTSSDDLFHTHKVNLCIRLDYNGYITSSLGLI